MFLFGLTTAGLLTGVQAFERNSTELCTTFNGYYGDLHLRGEPRLVAYQYTVTLSEDTSEEDFVEGVLPGLEEAISDAAVPKLFNCVRKQRVRHHRLHRRRLHKDLLSGLSARPNDIVSANVTCRKDEDNCLGMLGFVTFYFPDADSVDMSVADAFYEALQVAMDDGLFESDQILGTGYVGTVDDEDIPPGIEIPEIPDSNFTNATDRDIPPDIESPGIPGTNFTNSIDNDIGGPGGPGDDGESSGRGAGDDDAPVEIIAPVVAGGTLLCCALAYWAYRRRRAHKAPIEGKALPENEEQKEPEDDQVIGSAVPIINVSVDDSVWYTAGEDSAASSSEQSTTGSGS